MVRTPPSQEHRATVAAGFVTGLVSALTARAAARVLAAAAIDREVLADPTARVPVASYVALYNAVVAETGDEGFGLFRAPVQPGTFEFLCRAMLGAATLGESLERAARFLRIALPDLRVSILRGKPLSRLEIGETRRLRAKRDDPRRVFAYEWLLRLLHGVSCWLVARPVALVDVQFPFSRPGHAADYALIYTEHSRFGGASLAAALDAATLELPLRRENADLEAFLEGAPGKISMLYRRDRDTARSVREYVAAHVGTSPTLDEVARALGLSARTLHRRLHDEGTSFREVKDAVRREIALARLKHAHQRVADVAADLGYSEPSAFFRAFQSWTGEAPSAHRRRHARIAPDVRKNPHR
jgi:AraC-like DNA-binding protein